MARQGRNLAVAAARAFRPVSSHPLFPAIIALWFAALFGLCTLAVRPALLEALIHATGIERTIPAAASPLGMTARALIALAMAMGGGLIGMILGRVAATSRPLKSETATRSRDARRPAPRPISAHEELGHEQSWPPAHEIPAAPMNEFPSAVPACLAEAEEEHSPELAITPLELEPLPELVALAEQQFPPAIAEEEFAAEPTPQQEPVAIAPSLGKAAQRILSADLDTLTPIELVERLGISMQRRRAAVPATILPGSFAPALAPRARLHFAPSAQARNEQALRSALATLQKISGAA